MFENTLVYISPGRANLLSATERESLQNKQIIVAEDSGKAISEIEKNNRLITVFIGPDILDDDSEKFLRTSYTRLSTLADLQVIVADDPDMGLQSIAHEYGIKTFWASTNIATRLETWLTTQKENLAGNIGTVAELFKLGKAAISQDWKEMTGSLKTLEEEAKSDFRKALILGQYHLAHQNKPKAEEAFQMARTLNPMFVPSLSLLANVKLANGKAEEALGLLENLELVNDKNPERKTLMASACADLGRWEDSIKYTESAAKLEPTNPHVNEMRARVLFHAGKVDEAITILETCDTVNDYFLSKLNAQAVELAQKNETEKAMHLYNVTHKLAPEHLKHKISYNIALAHKRSGDFMMALIHANTAKSECADKNPEKIIALIDSLGKEKT